jgi:hypothetical protein
LLSFGIGVALGMVITLVMRNSSKRNMQIKAINYYKRLEKLPSWNLDLEIQGLQNEWESCGTLGEQRIVLLGALKMEKYLENARK